MSNTECVIKTELTGLKFAIPRDWVASKATLSDAVQKSVVMAKAAIERAGGEVVEMDFLPVIETNKNQWMSPGLPFVFDNSYEDFKKYLSSFGAEDRPVTSVEDLLATLKSPMLAQKFAKPVLEAEDLDVKVTARDEGRRKLEEAYRAFFTNNGVSALVVPCFPGEITKIDVENESRCELRNEYTFAVHMNEIPVPSIVLPVPSMKHPESGVLCSLMLWGADDRELLGHALGVEAALAVKEAS
jgi:Asp-tRNA(Asn)/Glu-tRNA(Gln) amidotransferase A subunit family amidase